MKGHGGKQSRKQEAAIAALLSHSTIPEAAKACGVSEVTIWRWMQDDGFQTAYRAARRQVVERAIAELQTACSAAVATLVRNLTCGAPAVEVSAAKTILDQATGAIKLVDMAERIEALESLLKPQEKTNKWA